jgi:hypothetical protein
MTITVVENGSGVDAIPSSRHPGPRETEHSPVRTRDVTPHTLDRYNRSPIAHRLVWRIADFRTPPSLLAGALLGLFVYAVNVDAATTVFSWFEAVAPHVSFGIASAGVYKMHSQRHYVHAHGATSEC